MRYVLDFGIANAGGAPTFVEFRRLDTLEVVASPAITEIEDGQYYFDFDWATTLATSISFKATLNGIELSDVISAPSVAFAGTTTATAGSSSLLGFEQVGPIVARAAVECGVASLDPTQIAAYDPFASTDPNVLQMLRLLDSLGRGLATKTKAHLQREFTLTTAASATSYALPVDYLEMVDSTLWNGSIPLSGPVTPQTGQFLRAWNGTTTVRLPYRLQGNRITFPVAPANGLIVTGLYVSRYWVQTAASGTGPDADHVTDRTDYVLFDPELAVLGLKLKFLTAKGFDTAIAAAEYAERLETVKGQNAGGRVLSLNGGGYTDRLVDECNFPVRLV